MCCINCNEKLVRLISKAIMDATLRERFLADPPANGPRIRLFRVRAGTTRAVRLAQAACYG